MKNEFTVQGQAAFLILPPNPDAAQATPWIWYAPTLPGLPSEAETWMFDQFLAQGIAIAGIDVGESFGSPKGRALYSALYHTLTQEHGLSKKTCLLARSRGGLMLYNWAVENPESVACVAGIYPVCNLTSYPGLQRTCGAYNMTEAQLSDQITKHNPIDRLAPLAKAKVPIFHIHGDIDEVVPLNENSKELAKRYTQLGGEITLKTIQGQGHNMWSGFFQCQELVNFIITHTASFSTS
ncbi:MAG: alpha/beta hydrolase family protein [Candidatus Latescibacterota bacterium]